MKQPIILLLLAALAPMAIAAEPSAGVKNMPSSKQEEQTTVRDRIWVWGHDASFDWPAHEVATGVLGLEWLRAGEIEIRVVNLWPNRIIGDLRNPDAKPFTYSQTQLYSPTDALLPSGLLGPVTLRAVPEVALTPK